jgi:hypothetical protein
MKQHIPAMLVDAVRHFQGILLQPATLIDQQKWQLQVLTNEKKKIKIE